MAKKDPKSLFRKLTNLFRSGPIVKRKIRGLDTTMAKADNTKSSGALLFQKSISPTYASISANAYNLSERLMRYQDFGDMEYTPEIASALDIYADETAAQDDKGRTLHVYSDNEKIKEVLESLFYDTLNVEFNLRSWVRSLVKYGDTFLYNDVSPEYGVVNAFPIPVNEIEREENYDKDDPFAVRYRWVTLGNRTLENWEVTHFRLLGNDMFLPYGSSVIEPARRIWRQLILIEDAMLVYRVVRAPERRVFYVDVANIPPENVPMYIEEQRKNLRSSQVIDNTSGRVDLRYNPMCISLKSLIKLQDGRALSLQDLITEWESGKQDQWVHSIDLENKQVVPGKISWAGVTRKNADLVRVHLDDGTCVDTTPDHKFMLRDGTYANAETLQPDQALMPLYVQHTKKEDGHKIVGYEKIYDPFSETYNLTHRNNLIATQGFDAIKGKVVHHKDYNKLNNNPDNLQSLTWFDHMQLHRNEIVKYNTSNIGRTNSKNRMKKTWASGAINNQMHADLWKNSDVRKKRVDALTLSVGDKLIEKMLIVMDRLNKGLSVREQEFLDAVNLDNDLKSYLRELNPNFKNGYVDKFTHGNLQIFFRKAGLSKSLESLKRVWLADRFNVSEIKRFCLTVPKCSRRHVLQNFGLSRGSFEELLRLNGEDIADFRVKYLPGNKRYSSYKNHKVVKVERLSFKEDTGCITVEKYHNFAAGNQNNDGSNSWILLHNSVDEDYFIPVRGSDTGTRIDTLAGGQNAAAVEDVAYIQKKLFAALKVPRAYLGYDEALSSKASLSQIDIRFSRTIAVIQKTVIAELNKLAIIHLFANGFDGEDLQNFTLHLSNPSTVAQQQKLELWRAKFEIGGSLPEGMGSKHFVQHEIWGLSEEEIAAIDKQRMKEKIMDASIEASAPATGEGGEAGGGGGADLFGDLGGGEETGGEETGGAETPPEENAGEEPEEDVEPGIELLTSADSRDNDEEYALKLTNNDGAPPIKPKNQLKHALYNQSRKRTHGASTTFMPDLNKMTGNDTDEMKDPYDNEWMKSVVSNPFGESRNRSTQLRGLSPDMYSTLKRMSKSLKMFQASDSASSVLAEAYDVIDVQDEIDKENNEELDFDYLPEHTLYDDELLISETEDDEDDR